MTNPERISDELRPCPFCGKAMERVEQSIDGPYWGHPLPGDDICPAAGFYLTDNNKKRAAEVAAWNARRSPPAQEGMVLDAPAREGGGPERTLQKTIDQEWQWLIERDDRTSPEEYPNHALITKDELGTIIVSAAFEFRPRPITLPAEPAAHSLQTLAPASDAVKPGDET